MGKPGDGGTDDDLVEPSPQQVKKAYESPSKGAKGKKRRKKKSERLETN